MVQLMETGYGTDKGIPQLILAGASLDDVFVIVLFSTFTGMAQGGAVSAMDFAGIPISILLGIAGGALTGWLLALFFESQYAKERYVRNSMKVIIVLGISAEGILFVLVGAAVDIRYTLGAGLGAVLMIFLALALRSAGVLLCLLGTKLNRKERLFCVIAYLPKATVQAAIGSVPLALGLPCGKLVLSVAVLSILITAPLGALGMDATYKRLLNQRSR